MNGSIPIIKLKENLLVSIQVELSDHLVMELKEDICEAIGRLEPNGLVIEVSGVDILDSYIARSIRDISQIARLMGVKSVIAGLDPAMAVTLVEMGMVLKDVPTTLNLESALERLSAEDGQAEAPSYFTEEQEAELELEELGLL